MRLVVADASAVVEFLLGTRRGRALERTVTRSDTDLHVPSLCDVEVAAALRGLTLSGRVAGGRARDALVDYLDLPLRRHDHRPLLFRLFELRANLSAYDAAYVALAERLDGALLTADEGLARAARTHTTVEVLPG